MVLSGDEIQLNAEPLPAGNPIWKFSTSQTRVKLTRVKLALTTICLRNNLRPF